MMSLRTHNILDYVGGAAVVLLSGAVANVPAARNLFMIVGFGVIAYSLLTNYRYSVAKLIPVGPHMALDVAGGVFLLAGPWLFGYSALLSGGQIGLHALLGASLIALVIFTGRQTETGWDTVRRKVDTKRTIRDVETAGRR